MKIDTAIKCMRKSLRLEPRTDERSGTTYWMTLDDTNSGSGVPGDETRGKDNYEKIVMFKALELYDPGHDWHEYDWHLLKGPAEERCAALIARRKECEQARTEIDPILAMARAMCGR